MKKTKMILFRKLYIYAYKYINILSLGITYLHSMLHLVANVANMVLYSGYIVPIQSNKIVKLLCSPWCKT